MKRCMIFFVIVFFITHEGGYVCGYDSIIDTSSMAFTQNNSSKNNDREIQKNFYADVCEELAVLMMVEPGNVISEIGRMHGIEESAREEWFAFMLASVHTKQDIPDYCAYIKECAEKIKASCLLHAHNLPKEENSVRVPHKKKSKNGVLVALACVGSLLAGGVSWLIYVRYKRWPDELKAQEDECHRKLKEQEDLFESKLHDILTEQNENFEKRYDELTSLLTQMQQTPDIPSSQVDRNQIENMDHMIQVREQQKKSWIPESVNASNMLRLAELALRFYELKKGNNGNSGVNLHLNTSGGENHNENKHISFNLTTEYLRKLGEKKTKESNRKSKTS